MKGKGGGASSEKKGEEEGAGILTCLKGGLPVLIAVVGGGSYKKEARPPSPREVDHQPFPGEWKKEVAVFLADLEDWGISLMLKLTTRKRGRVLSG